MFERITINPNVCHGKACIKDTRIPIHIILDLLSAGETVENILKAYPQITEDDVRMCLQTQRVVAFLKMLTTEKISRKLAIVEPDRVRFRE